MFAEVRRACSLRLCTACVRSKKVNRWRWGSFLCHLCWTNIRNGNGGISRLAPFRLSSSVFHVWCPCDQVKFACRPRDHALGLKRDWGSTSLARHATCWSPPAVASLYSERECATSSSLSKRIDRPPLLLLVVWCPTVLCVTTVATLQGYHVHLPLFSVTESYIYHNTKYFFYLFGFNFSCFSVPAWLVLCPV